jgi:hypothetical protein
MTQFFQAGSASFPGERMKGDKFYLFAYVEANTSSFGINVVCIFLAYFPLAAGNVQK